MLTLFGIICVILIIRYFYKNNKQKQTEVNEENIKREKKLQEEYRVKEQEVAHAKKVDELKRKTEKMREDTLAHFQNLTQKEIKQLINAAAKNDMIENVVPDDDSLFLKVLSFVIETQNSSSSALQRKFLLGYNKVSNYLDKMEGIGVIGPVIGPKNGENNREIYIKNNDEIEQQAILLNLIKTKYPSEIRNRKIEIENEIELDLEKSIQRRIEDRNDKAERLGISYEDVIKIEDEELRIMDMEFQKEVDEWDRDEQKQIIENQQYELELQREKAEEQREAMLQDQILAQKKMQEIQKNSSNSNASRSTLFLTGKCSNCWKKISKFSNRCPYCTSEIS